MIREYIKGKENMKLYKVYSDNGETGTNFDRQGFQNMMYDVYNGRVNCIIVKNLSRFGREYIEMGDYLEKIFPLIGVRFIAINDHYDNNVTSFDISVPIKNIINTLYAKDLSKKSAAALRIKQQNGEFIGTYAAYGYMKSTEDKHKIVIDEETAPVVKMIFEWKLEGFSYASICRKLYDMGIMPPCRYRYDKGMMKDKRYAGFVFWKPGTIKSMLENEVYIGNMVQGRRKSRFFDGKDEVKVDKDEWVVVKNTHEPIISEKLFYKVQDLMKNTRDKYYDNLGKYDINRHINFVQEDKEKYAKQLMDYFDSDSNGNVQSNTEKLKLIENRISELNLLIQKIYEDKTFGRITEEIYLAMYANMSSELKNLQGEKEQIKNTVSQHLACEDSINKFLSLIEQYAPVKELDEVLLNNLIEKIVVHERERVNNETTMPIEIYYRFVGKIDEAPKDMLLTGRLARTKDF